MWSRHDLSTQGGSKVQTDQEQLTPPICASSAKNKGVLNFSLVLETSSPCATQKSFTKNIYVLIIALSVYATSLLPSVVTNSYTPV